MKQLILLLIIPTILFADIFAMNKRLSRTLNLGNYLEAPNEGDWGTTLVKEDFTRIALKGFTAVRIPIRWSNHLESDGSIDSTFMNRVIWAVDEANRNGLTAIIDDHHFDSLMIAPDTYAPVIKSIWTQISEQLKKIPNDSLFFEPVNEPHTNLTTERWNTLLAEITTIIRQTNPNRPVIIGTTGWGGITGLNGLTLPDDSNLIVTIHYYLPFEFTHQGAEWVNGADAWLGTKWHGGYFEKKALRSDIEAVKAWSVKNNVPVFVGEFGSYSKADQDSRLRWTHYVARLFESYDIPWAYWEYSSGFGLFDPSVQVWRNYLTDTLLSTDTTTLEIDPGSIQFGPELIQNGDFSAGTLNWLHNVWGENATATLTFSAEGGAEHTVTSAGADFYQIQLIQSGITLEADKQYLYRVTISGDETAQISLGLSRSDYTSVVGGSVVTPSSTEQEIDLLVTPSKNETDLRALINLGYASGTVHISTVSLREVMETSSSTKTTANKTESITISVTNKKVSFSSSISENCTVKLFSLRGRQVLKQQGVSSGEIVLPGNLASGWYGIVVQEMGREVLRSSFMLE